MMAGAPMNRPFLLDETSTARLADPEREDGRAGFLAEARRQALAVADSPDAEADQAFVDAVSDWADA